MDLLRNAIATIRGLGSRTNRCIWSGIAKAMRGHGRLWSSYFEVPHMGLSS